MADWFHCNLCFQQPKDVSSCKFLLTNCGHIYCCECIKNLKNGSRLMCKLCNNQNCTTIMLPVKRKPEVEMYFKNPIEIMERINLQLSQMKKAMDFQKNHRQRLLAGIREKAFEKENRLFDVEKLVAKLKEYEREIRNLKEEVLHLRTENFELRRHFKKQQSLSFDTLVPPGKAHQSTPPNYMTSVGKSRNVSPLCRFEFSPSPHTVVVRTPGSCGESEVNKTPPKHVTKRFDTTSSRLANINPENVPEITPFVSRLRHTET